jgi:hypothetical protein
MLILNPSSDEDFRRFVEERARGAASPAELQAQLRAVYRKAIVRARDLSDEPISVWYVYRDGRWESSPREVRPADQLHEDIRATGEDLVRAAEHMADIEKRKLEPGQTHSELTELSEQAEDVADDLARKSRIEGRLVDELSEGQ